MKILTIKLSEPLHAKLISAARERGESRSALVREAIDAFIEGDDQPPHGSCLELAKDLVGSVKGPVDLSFNKKHMRGYGQ
jgi:hypothetical protein